MVYKRRERFTSYTYNFTSPVLWLSLLRGENSRHNFSKSSSASFAIRAIIFTIATLHHQARSQASLLCISLRLCVKWGHKDASAQILLNPNKSKVNRWINKWTYTHRQYQINASESSDSTLKYSPTLFHLECVISRSVHVAVKHNSQKQLPLPLYSLSHVLIPFYSSSSSASPTIHPFPFSSPTASSTPTPTPPSTPSLSPSFYPWVRSGCQYTHAGHVDRWCHRQRRWHRQWHFL